MSSHTSLTPRTSSESTHPFSQIIPPSPTPSSCSAMSANTVRVDVDPAELLSTTPAPSNLLGPFAEFDLAPNQLSLASPVPLSITISTPPAQSSALLSASSPCYDSENESNFSGGSCFEGHEGPGSPVWSEFSSHRPSICSIFSDGTSHGEGEGDDSFGRAGSRRTSLEAGIDSFGLGLEQGNGELLSPPARVGSRRPSALVIHAAKAYAAVSSSPLSPTSPLRAVRPPNGPASPRSIKPLTFPSPPGEYKMHLPKGRLSMVEETSPRSPRTRFGLVPS